MKTIVNAAPGVVNYGVKDESGRQYSRAPEQYPQHLPKFFIFAKKGPLSEELLVGADRLLMYGDEAFTERSKYFTHQSMVSNIVNAEGNAAMYVRMLPPDAGPRPNLMVYLDVLETAIDDYERNADGSYKTTINGDLIPIGTIGTAHKVKWVVEAFTDSDANDFFGQRGNASVGDQVDGSGNQSTRYPIFELEHSFFGEDGNLAGIRLWGLNTNNTAGLPTKMMAREKAFPFGFSVVRQNTETGTAGAVETIFGEQSITVTFKPEVVDPVTTQRLYFGERAVDAYQNLSDARYARKFGEFGKVKVYQDNIDLLLEKFHAAEVPFITMDSDFTADADDKGLFNFVTGLDSRAVPYHSFIFADDSNSVRFSATTNVYAGGGSDGTLDNDTFNSLVSQYMERYLNPNDELMDLAYHIESHIYDSGFSLDTKYDLINFISQRKDTFVVLSPFQYGEPLLSQGEEISIATSLMARLNLFPESEYFGTRVYRSMITGNSARLRASLNKEKLPSTMEVAKKSAGYMGASNGAWKSGNNFDGHPGSLIEAMYDPTITFVSDDIANRNWDVGLNWISRYDRSSFYFPALKTVYTDDTSVLTSYLTACAILHLHKIVHLTHRTFSGTSGLTPAQFVQRVNDFVSAQVFGKFDNRFIIRPRATFTAMDEIRNFSWTLPVEIYAPGMQTVETAYIVSRRIQDYAGD